VSENKINVPAKRTHKETTFAAEVIDEGREDNKRRATEYHLSRQTATPSIDAPMRRPNTTPILTTRTTPTYEHTRAYISLHAYRTRRRTFVCRSQKPP